MEDYRGQIIEDIKWTLFDDRDYENTFKFSTWTGDGSFIVKDNDGEEYRVTVTKENIGDSFTAFTYEDGNIAADFSTYDNAEDAIKFAKSHDWDEVVNDATGEVVWRR